MAQAFDYNIKDTVVKLLLKPLGVLMDPSPFLPPFYEILK